MQAGILLQTCASLQAQPQYASEIVSQLIFGEIYEVVAISADKRWLKVRNFFDNYEGWLNQKFHQPITEMLWQSLQKNQLTFCKSGRCQYRNLQFQVPWAAPLPFAIPMRFQVEEKYFQFSGEIHSASSQLSIENLLASAWKTFQGTPYLWGGRTQFGIDCSGLVQQIYRLNGISLPRDSVSQAESLSQEVSWENCQTGDLAFFEQEGKITHVGIVLKDEFVKRNIGFQEQQSSHWILHSYDQVSVDVLSSQGILRQKVYTHQLAFFKKLA